MMMKASEISPVPSKPLLKKDNTEIKMAVPIKVSTRMMRGTLFFKIYSNKNRTEIPKSTVKNIKSISPDLVKSGVRCKQAAAKKSPEAANKNLRRSDPVSFRNFSQ